MLTLAFNIQTAKASGTIYIRADGSVEGTTDISSADIITYTFTDNIYDSIVVERDNIVIDGANHTLQGTGSGRGIDLTERGNVTIKNVEMKAFDYGIYLRRSSNNNVYGNSITNNMNAGIRLLHSFNITISKNNITNHDSDTHSSGIRLDETSNNNIVGNYIADNNIGIMHGYSSNNSISYNNITNNKLHYGMWFHESANNTVYGNYLSKNGQS